MGFTLDDLGMTKEELQKRVVDQCCEQLMSETGYDEDGEEATRSSRFHRVITDRIRKTVDEAIDKLAQEHVLPNVAKYIEELTLQETNRWGEKTGKPVTFIEYLVSRAEHYMREEVDCQGKSQAQSGGYGWNKHSTRLVHLIHEHLAYSIKRAMEEAVGVANKTVKASLKAAVEMALAQIKVTVDTKVSS